MKLVRLNSSHIGGVKDLFDIPEYMGIDNFDNRQYSIFCDNYLSDLSNFHAYGIVGPRKKVLALISFYESNEEPSWYMTVYRSLGHGYLLKNILDKIIDYNENNGRLKFYTLVNQNHSKLLRRFLWSNYNNERYDYFDEYVVPERHKCFYINHWELLYKRLLIPVPTVIRCNFLKQEFRNILPIGGGL